MSERKPRRTYRSSFPHTGPQGRLALCVAGSRLKTLTATELAPRTGMTERNCRALLVRMHREGSLRRIEILGERTVWFIPERLG